MDGVLAELDSLVVQAEGTCPRRGRIANVLSIGDTEVTRFLEMDEMDGGWV